MRGYGTPAATIIALVVSAGVLGAQPPAPAPDATSRAAVDPLGRQTPRGTVLGLLDAGRAGDFALASQYLETRSSGRATEQLARQLFAVLDARLPPRLTQISDEPEGSRSEPLAPDRDKVGVIASASGNVDVYVTRVTRPGTGAVWLFSAHTLEAVPPLYAEVAAEQQGMRLPRFLTTAVGGLRLLDWVVVLVGLPLFFVATAKLDQLLVPILRPLWRRLGAEDPAAVQTVIPIPARLVLLVVASRWVLSWLPLSLLVRQFWSSATGVITVVSVVWLLILLNGTVEAVMLRRMPHDSAAAATSLLRVLRRGVDLLFIFCGLAVLLWYFGINPTPALAGLGVGGIAVALAAQRTLENVIAGAALVFDQAIRVGDFLRVGAIEGTVDRIGLRSTRIRTLDRTIVSVPNGQIANATLETLSARDKYWFHPEVRLRYETTAAQLGGVLEGIRRSLGRHPAVEPATTRVRFARLGPFSLDLEVSAYVTARDWNHFLELQEALLFGVTEAVEQAGTGLARPWHPPFAAAERAPDVLPSVSAMPE